MIKEVHNSFDAVHYYSSLNLLFSSKDLKKTKQNKRITD